MEEIINAITALSEKSWIDYIAIFSPIVLSLVAVVISIYTARKQNKIALFEIRMQYYNKFKEFVFAENEMRRAKDLFANYLTEDWQMEKAKELLKIEGETLWNKNIYQKIKQLLDSIESVDIWRNKKEEEFEKLRNEILKKMISEFKI